MEVILLLFYFDDIRTSPSMLLFPIFEGAIPHAFVFTAVLGGFEKAPLIFLRGNPYEAFLSARGEVAYCLAPDTVPPLTEKKPVLASFVPTKLLDREGRKFGSIPMPLSKPALLMVR